MPVFSSGRDEIFKPAPKVRFTVGDFPDFYALLDIKRDASPFQIEEAIVSRGADLLAASFSRGGRAELLVLLERHMNDFRPVLLDTVARIAYDEQLRRHEAQEPRAVGFEVWKQTYANGNGFSQRLQNVSRGLKERVKAAFWDAEYF
jgi:hypothetical protein